MNQAEVQDNNDEDERHSLQYSPARVAQERVCSHPCTPNLTEPGHSARAGPLVGPSLGRVVKNLRVELQPCGVIEIGLARKRAHKHHRLTAHATMVTSSMV